MSAYIVSDQTINIVATYIKNGRDLEWYRDRCYKAVGCQSDNCTANSRQLGTSMFALNVQAVNARYGEGEAEKFRPLDYKFRLEALADKYRAISAMNTWLYQCTEGTCDETELFKAVRDYMHALAMRIVQDSPQYAAANGGAI